MINDHGLRVTKSVSNYEGAELPLFIDAINWKHYLFSFISPMTAGRDVLEVGAGIGGTTAIFATGKEKSWLCLEPDRTLSNILYQKINTFHSDKIQIFNGTLESLGDKNKFDTIIYIDVLEHIANDAEELTKATQLLRKGGNIIIVSPAHQWLYSEFDKSVGHFRRYNKHSLRSLTPDFLKLDKIIYLDSVGLLASLSNLLILKQEIPTAKQIRLWDSVFVRLSRILDPLLGHSIGKSIYCVWHKTD